MIYLKDACVLIDRFDTLVLINTAKLYKDTKDIFALTDIIIDELYPGRSVEKCRAEKSKELLRGISILENSNAVEIYNVNAAGKYKENFERIRKAFYGHLKDHQFVKDALLRGEIKKDEFKNRTYI